MISVLELFDKDNILCPEWLSYLQLEDDWIESVYSYEDGKHTWNLKNDFKDVRITFDGEEYNFYAIDGEDLICLETITEEYAMQY